MTITLDIAQSTASSGAGLTTVGGGDVVFMLPDDAAELVISRRIPPLTDPEQAYFWTSDWQAAERAAELELATGEAPTFASLDEGMRWLLSNDA